MSALLETLTDEAPLAGIRRTVRLDHVSYACLVDAAFAARQFDYLDDHLCEPAAGLTQAAAALEIEVAMARLCRARLMAAVERLPRSGCLRPFEGVRLARFHAKEWDIYAVDVDEIDETNSGYLILRKGNRVRIVLADDAIYPERFLLMVMREHFYRSLQASGGVPMHAATLATRSEGLLIPGPSGSGKTTTVAAGLSGLPDAAFVANDRCVLLGRRAIGIPLRVRLTRSQITSTGELCAQVERRGLRGPQGAKLELRSLSMTFGTKEKAQLSARDFSEAFGRGTLSSCEPRSVLFPRAERGTRHARVVRLSQEETLQRLGGSCLAYSDPMFREPWFVDGRATSESKAAAARTLEETSLRLPAYEVAFDVRDKAALMVVLREHFA